jgi:hypothetical protein
MLFVWPLVHGFFVSMGMLNFAFAFPLSLILLTVLDRQREQTTVARGLGDAALAGALWYAHPFPLAVVGGLVALHALGGVCSSAEWADTRVIGPFVCHADFPLAEMGGLFTDLAQLQNDLMRVLEIPPARERIEVYLFHDQPSYREYVGRYLPQVPYRRALYVKLHGPGMVFAYRSREFDVDLRHECTHALLHAVLPIVPLWLDEGLAEYFEVPPAQRAYDNPHLSAVRWAVRFGMPPKLESLEKKSELSDMGKAEYRGAWAWVHFMIHGFKSRIKLSQITKNAASLPPFTDILKLISAIGLKRIIVKNHNVYNFQIKF